MKKQILGNNVYDVLKWVAIIALPAISTFIVVVSKIWGWADMGGMIAQTITAVGVLLGALLGVSSIQYDGSVEEIAEETEEPAEAEETEED